MPPFVIRVLIVGGLCTTMVGAYACGGAPERPAPAGDGDSVVLTGSVGTKLRTGVCTSEGARETCEVETGRSGTVVNCFRGTQTCSDGRWTPCGEGREAGKGNGQGSGQGNGNGGDEDEDAGAPP